jgi:hypothetical protein
MLPDISSTGVPSRCSLAHPAAELPARAVRQVIIGEDERPRFPAVEERLRLRETAAGGDVKAAFLEITHERLEHFDVVVDHQQSRPARRLRPTRQHGVFRQGFAQKTGTHGEKNGGKVGV